MLNVIGAVVTAGLGLMGLIRPAAAAVFTSMAPVGTLGVSEIRATYGGFFLALGAYALWAMSPPVFTTLGIAWLGAAAGRAISVIVDKSREPKNLGGIAFEAAIGLLCIA